jgi:sodium/hydrogen exchanger 5
VVFTGITLAACLISRFIGSPFSTLVLYIYCLIGIYMLTYVCNKYRMERIGLLDQFIMAYGGLRGAICYGLVMTLDKNSVPAKDMFVSTTVVVICFTVFIQGTTIKPLVKFLRVKTQEQQSKTVAYAVIANASDDMMAGIEAITGIHGKFYWRRKIDRFDREYVRPFLTIHASSKGDELVEKYEQMNAIESGNRRVHALATDDAD